MSVLIKNLSSGVKKIIINDPKTYNSLSFQTLNSLLNTIIGREYNKPHFIRK